MIKITLDNQEKSLIREITTIQLEDLLDIRSSECSEDLVMFCIKEDIKREDLNTSLDDTISLFEDILHNPENFINLQGGDMKIFKHILFNIKGFKKAKQKLSYKLILLDFINSHLC